MSESNGSMDGADVRLALLEQSAKQHKNDIETCQRKIAAVDDHLEDVRSVQNESLLVLQKMETNLEHMNEKLQVGAAERKELSLNQQSMSEAFSRTDAKFKVMVGILSAIGVAILGILVKVVFFFPSAGG